MNKPFIPVGEVIPFGEATQRATMAKARASSVQAPNIKNAPREAYSEGNRAPPPEAHVASDAPLDGDLSGVWKPPVRVSIIDRQPTHPHVADSKTQIRG